MPGSNGNGKKHRPARAAGKAATNGTPPPPESSAVTSVTATEVDGPPAGSPVVVVQPHGGALQVGNPGNRGGLGAPSSIIRERLRGGYEDRLGFLTDVIDGKVMQTQEIPLVFVLPHVKCPLCGAQGMKLKDPDDAFLPVRARVSASVKDRLTAMDQMAKYGVGTLKEVSVENVRERMRATMAIIREHTPPELAAQLAALIRPVWK